MQIIILLWLTELLTITSLIFLTESGLTDLDQTAPSSEHWSGFMLT